MTEASGRVIATPKGRDLVLVRSLALSIDDAWEYLTDSSLTEKWFGPWEGDGRPGSGIRVRMRFEEGEPEIRIRVLACESPRRLALHAVDEYGNWELELGLEADGDEDTLLHFVHHLDAETDVGDIGPGWEYYLDLLVAATEETEQPMFDQYYPALRQEYLRRDI